MGVVLLLVVFSPLTPAAAQVFPTRTVPPPTRPAPIPTTLPPTQPTAPPIAATTRPARPSSTRIPVATTAPRTTGPPEATVATDPDNTVLSVDHGGGTINPFFAALSVGGFLATAGMIGRRWYLTRPND